MRDNLRQARHDKNLTQEQVAVLAGISRPYYTQIELGQRTPSVDDARRVAFALGGRVEDFFALPPASPREASAS